MLVALSRRLAQKLSRLPEAGMGYHLVEVTLKDGRRLHNLVVLNSEFLDFPDFLDQIEAADILDITPEKIGQQSP